MKEEVEQISSWLVALDLLLADVYTRQVAVFRLYITFLATSTRSIFVQLRSNCTLVAYTIIFVVE